MNEGGERRGYFWRMKREVREGERGDFVAYPFKPNTFHAFLGFICISSNLFRC